MSTAERDFIVEPSEDFLCPICAKVLVEPHVTECCGQHFCEQCLTKWFKEQGSVICPHCRSKDFTHIRYLPMKRKINDLQVFCSNKKDGCTLITTVSQLESHLSECSFATVKCPLNCGLSLLRKDIIGHRTNDCRNRISTCIYCKKRGKHYVITGSQHVMSCPDIQVGCPKNCPDGRSVKRKDLDTHKLICPLESVCCSDCLAEMQRQQLSKHRLNTCPKRFIICKHCKAFGTFDHITGQHVNECEEFPTGCPRKCQGSEQMKRKNVKSHSEVCPLEPVQCPFSEVGCKPQLVRRDLNSHMKSNLEQHMLKVMTSHTQVVAEHERLKGDHDKLKDDHIKLKDDHSKLRDDHSKLKDDHSKLKDDHSKLKEDHNKLKDDHSKLKDDHSKLKDDHNKLKDDRSKLKDDYSKVKDDHSKLKDNDCSKLSSEFVDIQAKRSSSLTSSKVESSISRKSGIIKSSRDVGKHTTYIQRGGIKTALNPTIKGEGDKLVLDVPEIEGHVVRSLFSVLDGYQMCLEYKKIHECYRSSWFSSAGAKPKIAVSLHLMKGDKDDSLKWPINSRRTLKIVLKSIANLKKRVDLLEDHRMSISDSFDLLSVRQTSHEEIKIAVALNSRKSHINLDRVEEVSRELQRTSMYSCGPLKAEITLLN